MMINNEIFGKLIFDYIWSRNEEILFNGKKEDIVLLVAGDEDGEFEEGQYEAYKMLKSKWDGIQEKVLSPILKYYKDRREELGYNVQQNANYPDIKTVNELLNYITLVGIKVPYAGIYGGRSIGLSFDCFWDEENGLGIRLNDESVIEVGFQDIAI